MAGYSGTPLPKKLGINEGHRVAVLRAPAGLHNFLRPLPDGVALRDRARGPLDVVLYFVTRRAELARRLVDNKMCAIDDVWSGLRLVIRLENR